MRTSRALKTILLVGRQGLEPWTIGLKAGARGAERVLEAVRAHFCVRLAPFVPRIAHRFTHKYKNQCSVKSHT